MTKLKKMGALDPQIMNANLSLEAHFALCGILSHLHLALEEILISLESFENSLSCRKDKAIDETKKLHAKWQDEGPCGGWHPNYKEEALNGIEGLFNKRIPLLAYYNSLIATVAAIEHFVPVIGYIVLGNKSPKEYREVIKRLAGKAGVDCSRYRNFHEVRNALVHKGGIANTGQEKAAEALGFSLSCVSWYPDGFPTEGNGWQIIIDRPTLEKHIVALHSFIEQISVKAAGLNKIRDKK